ncbi:MAG: 1-acyl-sn-glycerol-3-phosphate acyltransferase [Clostridia bacterium]|nr:1-acyl-sn-glycerol-3-phosphate acyltransferase [Clostridia bacterium]
MNKETKHMRKGYIFNKIFIETLALILHLPLRQIFNLKPKYHSPKHKTFILISNHTSSIDPAYIVLALKNRYVRFVASDHVTRMGFLGFVLKALCGIIVKRRDKAPDVLINDILGSLKAGVPVALFAEGNTSFNGETGFISPNTGKMVKDSGVALVTFRFDNGYLLSARWSEKKKKGTLRCGVVNEYSAQELAGMTVDEVNEIIRRDTYVNAFDEQRRNPVVYTGENMAEYLERILYICPDCKTVGHLHSKGDSLKCGNCGYTVEYGNDAFFHNESNVVFDNVLDWDKWQREIWKDKVLSAKSGEVIFEESGMSVSSVRKDSKTLVSKNATLQLFNDKFRIILSENETVEMRMCDVKKVWTSSPDAVVIIDDRHYYDIVSPVHSSAIKYIAAWQYLRGKDFL